MKSTIEKERELEKKIFNRLISAGKSVQEASRTARFLARHRFRMK